MRNGQPSRSASGPGGLEMMEGPGPGVFAGIFGGAVGSGTFSSGIVIGTSRIPAPSESDIGS